jgi:hypothetical protein
MFEAAWTIILTGLFGVSAYSYQKYVDRKSALIELRRATYAKYLSLLSRNTTKKTAASADEMYSAYMEMSVIASDEVVRAVGSFHQLILGRDDKTFDAELVKDQLASAILSMRKDCFERSNLTREEVLSVTPLVDEKK